jgi:hypothetical protein
MPLEYYRKREIPEYGGIPGAILLECAVRAIRLTFVPNRSHVDRREITLVPSPSGSGARHAGCLTRKEDA